MWRNKKLWLRASVGLIVPVALALALAACGGSGGASGAPTASTSEAGGTATGTTNSASGQKKHYTFAMVAGALPNPFYSTVFEGAKAEANKIGGISLTFAGGGTFTPEVQIPIVDATLAKHPDALLISPTDIKALIPPVKRFSAAGIPVVAIDTTIADKSLLTTEITASNSQGGQLAADEMGKDIGGKGTVAVLDIAPGISSVNPRATGFIQEMRKKFPNVTLLPTQYTGTDQSKAQSTLQSQLLAHPDIVGVFGTALFQGQGAAQAVKAAGKQGKIVIAAYDASPSEVQLFKQGAIQMLVVQKAYEEGQLAVRDAYAAVTGKKPPHSELLANVLATKANADDPSVTKFFYHQ